MTVMAPGDAHDLPAMLDLALVHDGPCAIRYPKATAVSVAAEGRPVEFGKAEVVREGDAGAILCCGALLSECLAAAEAMAEEGIELTVVNARFLKPLDTETILPLVADSPFVVTVEEAALAGGFGSAMLEAAADAGIPIVHVTRLGIPDRYIEHGEREELLADLGLDAKGIAAACRARCVEYPIELNKA
jgi:1-deoxy-D-xylulose-5-phosphate synthase